MRTIGIDLALTAARKAVVADAQGHFLTPALSSYRPLAMRIVDTATLRLGICPPSAGLRSKLEAAYLVPDLESVRTFPTVLRGA